MGKHIVIGGNGPVGRQIVRLLAADGEESVVVSRSSGLRFDASDADALTRASAGASTIHLCAMPRYDRWPQEFQQLMESTVVAAERVGARIVSIGNTYLYGEGAPSPLTEDLPHRPTTVKGRVRAEMWERALASTAPAIEVRGSDYLGHGAVSLFTLMVQPAVLEGRVARVPMDLDAEHPWTFVSDVARTAVAAARINGPTKQVFHVPSTQASLRTVASRLATLTGAGVPKLERMPLEELVALGEHDSIIREVVEVAYLLDRAFTLDASKAERVLGVHATPLDEVLRDAFSAR
ncbi:NAD-dependent epimerase/dehydratase family protein [Corallococcus carmarthensis]|nr:NAD-dependent epimerase/dehydratase family protein [Corallococcus carmarthensis]